MQTIKSQCIGCQSPMLYEIHDDPAYGAPEFSPAGHAVAYKGGHLCAECERVAEAAFELRRQPLEFRYAGRACRVSSAETAVAIWEAYLARTGFGVSDAGNGGPIVDTRTGRVVAAISYNGRIWPAGGMP